MDMALVWVFACYVFIGITLATIGPVRRALDEAVVELREGPSADDDSNSRIVPTGKVFLFRAVMSLAIATLWPRFVFFVVSKPQHHKMPSTEHSNSRDMTSRMNSAADSSQAAVTAFALPSTSHARSQGNNAPASDDASFPQPRLKSARPGSDLTDRST